MTAPDRPITVTVTFPDGARDVPAHMETPGSIDVGGSGTFFAGPRRVPNEMPGWRFVPMADGRWYAVGRSTA